MLRYSGDRQRRALKMIIDGYSIAAAIEMRSGKVARRRARRRRLSAAEKVRAAFTKRFERSRGSRRAGAGEDRIGAPRRGDPDLLGNVGALDPLARRRRRSLSRRMLETVAKSLKTVARAKHAQPRPEYARLTTMPSLRVTGPAVMWCGSLRVSADRWTPDLSLQDLPAVARRACQWAVISKRHVG